MASISPTTLSCPKENHTSKHGYVKLTITGISQSTANNQTTVDWKITVEGTPWVYLYALYVSLGGKVLFEQYSTVLTSWSAGQVIKSGTTTFDNGSDGSLTLNAYIKQLFYYGYNSSRWNSSSYVQEGSAGMVCSQIPRQANLTSAPNFNDEANPTISYSNPAGNAVSSLQACISLTGASDDVGYRDISKTGSSYTFNLTTAERNVLRNACTTSNSRNVIFYVKTVIGGNTFYSTIQKTLSIVNANPTFTSSNISYKDNNSATVAVTGNNQHLVQNLSKLLVTLSSATGNKGASISKYVATINGVSKTITSAGNIDYGVINSGTNLTLSVKVTDSRGNTATASKTVTFLAWSLPSALINLKRKNNYENETYLKVDGSFSSVNSKNSLTIQYQYKKTTETSYSSLVTISDNVQVTMTKDKESAWDFKIILKDKFGTTTYNAVLPKGRFILFVDTKKLSVGINCFPSNSESLEVNGVQVLEYDEIASW